MEIKYNLVEIKHSENLIYLHSTTILILKSFFLVLQNDTALVIVTVDDFNDEAPKFTTTCPSIDVREDVDIGTVICIVHAVDADEDGMAMVVYNLTNHLGG